jgi:large subunit ribosomal protein L2
MKFVQKNNSFSNSSRHHVKVNNFIISKKNRFDRVSISCLHRKNGKCLLTGTIVAWHRGGGKKNLFRKLNFSNRGFNSVVVNIFYDPCRNAFGSLNFDLEKLIFFRTIATTCSFPGMLSTCNAFIYDLKLGDKTKISNIPSGSLIYNLSKNFFSSSNYIRSAGTTGQIIQKFDKNVLVRLPSGNFITISRNAFACVGIVSNVEKRYTVLGKAGRNRLLNNRPITRGVAMNPVDHPHGGRTNGGRPSVTPWGLPTKSGFKLRRKKHLKNN